MGFVCHPHPEESEDNQSAGAEDSLAVCQGELIHLKA